MSAIFLAWHFINAWNKCLFHHFRGMLVWKSGLSFYLSIHNPLFWARENGHSRQKHSSVLWQRAPTCWHKFCCPEKIPNQSRFSNSGRRVLGKLRWGAIPAHGLSQASLAHALPAPSRSAGLTSSPTSTCPPECTGSSTASRAWPGMSIEKYKRHNRVICYWPGGRRWRLTTTCSGCTTATPCSSWLPAPPCSLRASSSGSRSTATCEERNFPETWWTPTAGSTAHTPSSTSTSRRSGRWKTWVIRRSCLCKGLSSIKGKSGEL